MYSMTRMGDSLTPSRASPPPPSWKKILLAPVCWQKVVEIRCSQILNQAKDAPFFPGQLPLCQPWERGLHEGRSISFVVLVLLLLKACFAPGVSVVS